MSTHYDLYCVTCDTAAGFHWNQGARALAERWAHRDAVAAMLPAVEAGIVEEVSFGYGENSGGSHFVRFAAAHRSHDVRVRDEYGRYATDCAKPVECPTCSVRHDCKLDAGHDGPCSCRPR